MQLLDGRKTAEDIKNEIAAQVQKMKNNGEKVPHLAAVIVGNDGAYVAVACQFFERDILCKIFAEVLFRFLDGYEVVFF